MLAAPIGTPFSNQNRKFSFFANWIFFNIKLPMNIQYQRFKHTKKKKENKSQVFDKSANCDGSKGLRRK